MPTCAVTRDLNAYQGEYDRQSDLQDLLGYKTEEYLPLTVGELYDRLPPDDANRFQDILDRLALKELDEEATC